MKMEELQLLFGFEMPIEQLLRAPRDTPEMVQIFEQKKALERAENLMRFNKDLERRIETVQHELQDQKKEKIVLQETNSQKFIVLNTQLE